MGAQIGSVEAVATFKNSDTKIDLAGTFKYPIFLKKNQDKFLIPKLISLVRLIIHMCNAYRYVCDSSVCVFHVCMYVSRIYVFNSYVCVYKLYVNCSMATKIPIKKQI